MVWTSEPNLFKRGALPGRLARVRTSHLANAGSSHHQLKTRRKVEKLWKTFTYMLDSLLPGIIPVRLLLLNRSSTRFVNLPSSGGIAPFNWFAWRSLGHKRTVELWIWRNADRKTSWSASCLAHFCDLWHATGLTGNGPHELIGTDVQHSQVL